MSKVNNIGIEITCLTVPFGTTNKTAILEVARILRRLVSELESGREDHLAVACNEAVAVALLRDADGNVVGEFRVDGMPEETLRTDPTGTRHAA